MKNNSYLIPRLVMQCSTRLEKSHENAYYVLDQNPCIRIPKLKASTRQPVLKPPPPLFPSEITRAKDSEKLLTIYSAPNLNGHIKPRTIFISV